MTLGIVAAFSAVGAVLALGPVFATRRAAAPATPGWGILVTSFGIGMGIGMASSNKVVEFVEREIRLRVVDHRGRRDAVRPRRDAGRSSWRRSITVVLGAFCGSAWVSGYVLLQENVTDEFRGRTFAALTVLSRLGLFLSLTLFPVTRRRDRRALPDASGRADDRPVRDAGRVDGRRGSVPARRRRDPSRTPTVPGQQPAAARRSCRS